MTIKVFEIEPLAKPRQTRSDVWKKRPCVVRYRTWADELRALAGPWRAPEGHCSILFVLPMPGSWSNAKRILHEGAPHKQKPDLDNLFKAWCDALLPESDAHVWSVTLVKRWGTAGQIVCEY